MNPFQPYGVITTEYILPAAAVISCGAKLHDNEESGEDPCIRCVDSRDSTKTKTIFQFHEMTSTGLKVRDLFREYKQLDFGKPTTLPEDHVLILARRVLLERNRLHLWYQKLMSEPVMELLGGYGTTNTKFAAALSCLGHEIKDARRIGEGQVAFFFDDNAELRQFEAAFHEPWGQYALAEDHVIYHLRGALENRDQLIILLKRASVRCEVKQDGKTFSVPLNASREKLTNMIHRLNQ